jgi:hypothetical protein
MFLSSHQIENEEVSPFAFPSLKKLNGSLSPIRLRSQVMVGTRSKNGHNDHGYYQMEIFDQDDEGNN